jgi:hypothetical protein
MADPRTGSPAGGESLCAPFPRELRVAWASVSVFDGAGRQSTICATDPIAARLDELQLELGEGPQWDALRTALPVLVPSLDDPPRSWPAFTSAARLLGVKAVFAFPMFLGAVIVGVVGLASPRVVTFGPVEIAAAVRLTTRTSRGAVQRALRDADDERSPEGPSNPAMRREVHQATGMILAQLDITATEAFVRLRAHAFATSRSVQDVARDVVARELDFRDLDG